MKARQYIQIKAQENGGGGGTTGTSGVYLWGDVAGTGHKTPLGRTGLIQFDFTAWDSIALGSAHGVGIKDGKLYTWGNPNGGRLGNGGTTVQHYWPVQIGTDTNWIMCAANNWSSMALKKVDLGGGVYEYQIYATGFNSSGDLGLGNTTTVTSFTRTGATITDWKYIAMGENTAFAIAGDGRLFACGAGTSYGTGLNSTSTISSWTCYNPANTGFKMVSGGNYFGVAIKDNGEAWSWGANTYGRTGQSTESGTKAVPTRIGTASDWNKVACGYHHTLLLKTDGSLFTCGYGLNGRLGQGNTNNYSTPTRVGTDTDWEDIGAYYSTSSGGYYEYSLAIKGGKLYGAGINTYRQLILDPSVVASSNTFIELNAKTGFTHVIGGNGFGMAMIKPAA